MSCYAQWGVFVGSAVAFGAGDSAAEFFTAGAATPAVIAAAVGEVAALIGEGMELYNCYQEQGDHSDAESLKAKLDALQAQMAQLQAAAGH